MTRYEVIAELQAIEQLINSRVAIVRVIVNESGQEVGRIVRGYFTPNSQSEPNDEGDRS